MDKIRVYELSKQLNTTSKRLMEKLKEINIEVKNHMSLLNENELNALYDYIGVIRQDKKDEVVTENKVKKQVQKPEPSKNIKTDTKNDAKKDKKSAPRIIRKTEIIIDDGKEIEVDSKEKPAKQQKGKFKRNKGIVKKTDANSGLRMGFVRDTGIDYTRVKKNDKVEVKKDDIVKKVEKDNNVDNIDKVNNTINNERIDKVEKNEKVNVANSENKNVHNKGPRTNMRDKKPFVKRDNKKEFNKTGSDDKNRKDITKPRYDNRQGNQANKDGNFVKRDNNSKPRFSGDAKKVYKNQNDDKKDNKGVKPLNIPKPQVETQKDSTSPQRLEAKRDFNKDGQREKKDFNKSQPYQKKPKVRSRNAIMGEKKGVTEVLSDEFVLEEMFEDNSGNRPNKFKRRPGRGRAKIEPPKVELKIEVLKEITIGESLTVKDLAEAMKKTSTEIIKKFMGMGFMVTLNQEVDFDSAALVAEEFGITAHKRVEVTEEEILFDDTDDNDEDLEPRPPIVTVMGHVDHGKTSLLDAIRETNIIEKEAGGITQHIGAYTVNIHDRIITFLDTPGHEAFTSMRARGTQVTDIAVLVVAADDGIMPQTVEAINHAKAANVAIIVAINKIDKVGANPDKVKQDLTSYGLVPEEWGGDVICVPVSAKQKLNIPQLLEMILLSADVMELKANKNKQAKGSIIEAKIDKNRGPVATVLVQRGTLNVGDTVVTGSVVGRIRAMTDDRLNKTKSAGPSTPVEILGLPDVPEAGETFYAVDDEKVAKQLVEKRKQKSRELSMRPNAKISLDDLFSQIKEGKVKELNIIVRADVQGSVEAVKQSIEKLSNDEVRIKIIHGGVGAITKSDVILADVSNAIIIGFNVRPAPDVVELAKNNNVDVRLYRIIYNAIEDIQAAMKGMLDPTYKEQIQGHAEIRQLFKVSSIGTIGGCYVLDGKITRNSEIRIVRNGVVVHEGKLSSLKRFKEDTKEVAQGYECGLSIEKYNDIKESDIIEAYEMVKVEV